MEHGDMPDILQRLAADIGGQIEHVGPRLPDGSGYAVMSMPLPSDHWSLVQTEQYEPPPMPFRKGTDDPQYEEWVAAIRAAGQYAYRAATMQGRDPDLDPDALVQNFVTGLIGYHTRDGLSQDAWANPDPLPDQQRRP